MRTQAEETTYRAGHEVRTTKLAGGEAIREDERSGRVCASGHEARHRGAILSVSHGWLLIGL